MADALLRSSETTLNAKSENCRSSRFAAAGLPAEIITKTEGITDHGILPFI